MHITDILSPADIVLNADISGVKQLLLKASEHLSAHCNGNARTIFDALIERERLGSTAMGKGIAIPHGRLAGLSTPIAMLIRTHTAIAFDAEDAQKVDIFFIMLVPEEQTTNHLKLLASIVKLLRNTEAVQALRHSTSSIDAYHTLEKHLPHA